MSEPLPVTGAATSSLSIIGAALVALGGLCVDLGRRMAAHRA